MAQGLTPGPQLMEKNPEIAYAFIVSMIIANIGMLLIGYLLVRVCTRILDVPKLLIIPAVISISFLGAYALRNSMFDVLLMILSGGIAYLLLKAKIGANRWDGTVPGAYEVWESAFADTGSLILMQDNQDMSVVIGLAGTPLDAVMRNLLLQGYLPLKPEGVRVAWYAVAPERGPLLGWNCETGGLSGWGKGIWPVRLEPLP